MRIFERAQARVEIWPDLSQLSARAAQLFIETARHSVTTNGRFTVALSGGSTPRSLYRLLAEKTSHADWWKQTHVFWSDERCVPPTDARSNYHLAHEALLVHVPVPAQQVHRLRGEDDPALAAADYALIIKKHFARREPRFDLILLGLGEDCHTASLFPHSPVLSDLESTVAAPFVEKLGEHRLTLTLRVLNHAAHVIFLVSGKAKATALRAVFAEEGNDASCPARLVRPVEGTLRWLADEEAAQALL